MEKKANKFRKINLLLVEDDDINAKIIIRFLEGEYEVTWVKSGQEAIDLVSREKFDGFLMDISLKGELDGLMTAGEIKKIHGYESAPIIAVTAFAMVGDKERFLHGGCSHYISKPFTRPEFLYLLKKAFA